MRTRRSSVIVCSFVLLLALAGCTTTQPQPATSRFKILHINDVYKIEGLEGGQSGGLARLRTLRKHLECDGTPVLVLHAGYALYPSAMSKYLEARPMVDVLNLLDGEPNAFDPNLIVTLGNHELDPSTPDVLVGRLRESAFEWVATNTVISAPSAPEIKKTILIDAAGTRIGLFGILYPLQKSYARSSDVLTAAR